MSLISDINKYKYSVNGNISMKYDKYFRNNVKL